MKNTIIKLGAALAMALIITNAALAESSLTPNGATQKPSNGAYTVHFTAAYDNGIGGYFTAAGERIVKTGPKAFTKDSETILISDISSWPAGTYVIQDYILWVQGVPLVWNSDFDGQTAFSGTMVVTDNGDGTGTLNAVLYYYY